MAKKTKVNTPYQKLPVYVEKPNLVTGVIETPKGSRNKYKYEPDKGLFILHQVLPAGTVFPYDFGYIPGTLGADGDPLDILLFLDQPAFTGCVVSVRLVGVIEANQTEQGKTVRNDRLVGVAHNSQDNANLTNLKEVSEELLQEIEHFFISYGEMEGKKFEPLGCYGPKRAAKLVDDGIKAAKKSAS